MIGTILDASPDVDKYRVYVFEDESDASLMASRDATPKLSTWRPIRVRTFDEKGGKRKPIADISGMVGLTLFSERAYEVTHPLLKGCGEFLPFICGSQRLWGFNVTRLIDCLDENASELVRFPSTGRVMDVRTYVFQDVGDLGVCIFGIPQFKGIRTYSTEATRDLFTDHGLTGMSFRKLR